MVSFCLCTYCTSTPYAEHENTSCRERSQAASMQYGNEPYLTWTSVFLSRGHDICWVEFKYLHRRAGWGVLFVSAHWTGLSYGTLIDLSSSILPQFLVKCLMMFIVNIIQLEKHNTCQMWVCCVMLSTCLYCAYAHVCIYTQTYSILSLFCIPTFITIIS